MMDMVNADYSMLERRISINVEMIRQGLRAEHNKLNRLWHDGKATTPQMVRCAVLDTAVLNNYEDLL